MRDKIEQSGRENRWEFSKTALFERSAHVGEVCARLEAMLDTVHNFRHFLGPQLESMTGSGKARALPQPYTLGRANHGTCRLLLCTKRMSACPAK